MKKKFLNMREKLMKLILMIHIMNNHCLQLHFLKNRLKKILSNTIKKIISKFNSVQTQMKSYYILNYRHGKIMTIILLTNARIYLFGF